MNVLSGVSFSAARFRWRRDDTIFALLECSAKAVRLGSDLNDGSAVGDAIDQRLHKRALGITEVDSENGRSVVTTTAAFSAR